MNTSAPDRNAAKTSSGRTRLTVTRCRSRVVKEIFALFRLDCSTVTPRFVRVVTATVYCSIGSTRARAP